MKEENLVEENKQVEQMETEEKTEKKQETIMDTANTKETRNKNKKEKSKTRMILVILFLLVLAGISYIQLRGSFLEYQELGEQYISIFYTNMFYRYTIMGIHFLVLYFVI